jgi:hypothetical protein
VWGWITWVVVGLAVWVVVALLVGVLVGRVVRVRDRQVPRGPVPAPRGRTQARDHDVAAEQVDRPSERRP